MSFLKNIFSKSSGKPEAFLSELTQSILEIGKFELSFDIKEEEGSENKQAFLIDFFGQDEGLLLKKDGELLEELQFFLKKALKTRFPEEKIFLSVDCDNFRERKDAKLLELVAKLKSSVLKSKKPATIKPLNSKQRKKVYEFLESEKKIKAQSIGHGVYKKIKLSFKS